MEQGDLEARFHYYWDHLTELLPDGILAVNHSLLQELDLDPKENLEQEELSQGFYILESVDKLTLFNERFTIWIVPKWVDKEPVTYLLIASNTKQRLEVCLSTTKDYNHSGLVLRVIEKVLEELDENDKEIVPYLPL